MNGMQNVTVLLALSLMLGALSGAYAQKPLSYTEVHDLVKEHMAGSDPTELGDAAARGLIARLGSRVVLVESEGDESGAKDQKLISSTKVYDKSFGYVRVQSVGGSLAKDLEAAVKGLIQTNKIKGLVIDLRYASGVDYGVAAMTADLFFSGEMPLIDYGDGVKKSTAKESALTLPLAVLVNGKTGAAAEALAAILRSGQAGLVIGVETAGHASIFKEFELKSGQKLRIATADVRVGEDVALGRAGVTPDIAVDVSEADERTYFDDPYADPEGRGSVSRRRVNEAELVRRRRQGDGESAAAGTKPEDRPILRDPSLGRALDLLKGIAVVRRYGVK